MISKYIFPVKVKSVYDADTFTGTIDLGFGLHMSKQKFRLYGINAYEVTLRHGTTVEEKQKGISGRDAVRKLLIKNNKVLVETVKTSKGKYGRYLAIVWVPGTQAILEDYSPVLFKHIPNSLTVSGEPYFCLNHWIVASGYGIEYEY